jgi:hypothetical protein
MKHKIEIYGEGTRELISILLKRANAAVEKFNSISNDCYLQNISHIYFSEIKELGYYVVGTMEIVLSKRLLENDISMEFLDSIVLHETAHYINWIINEDSTHSKEFKDIVQKIGAPLEFTNAKVSLEIGKDTSSQLSKIKKLLALSGSSNANESHSALTKARKMMAELNIQSVVDRTLIYTTVLCKSKRLTTRYRVLLMLTRDISGVFPINTYDDDSTYRLQRVFGTKSQIEIAIYIYEYLNYQLEKEYKDFKKNTPIKGRTIESFYYGVYTEMCQRFNKKTKVNEEDTRALQVIQNDNKEMALEYYFENTNLTKGRSGKVRLNATAYNQGKKVGERTTIHSGINKDKSNKNFYLK